MYSSRSRMREEKLTGPSTSLCLSVSHIFPRRKATCMIGVIVARQWEPILIPIVIVLTVIVIPFVIVIPWHCLR
jgi:hypothetical protein